MCLQPIHMPVRDYVLFGHLTLQSAGPSPILSRRKATPDLKHIKGPTRAHLEDWRAFRLSNTFKNIKCSFWVSIWTQSQAVITGMGRDRMSLAKTTGKRNVSWNLVCLHYLRKANMSSSNWANSPDLREQLIIKHAQQPKFQQYPRAALSSLAWLWTDQWPSKFMSVCKTPCGRSSDRGNKTIFRFSSPAPWRCTGSDPPRTRFQTSVQADYCNCA